MAGFLAEPGRFRTIGGQGIPQGDPTSKNAATGKWAQKFTGRISTGRQSTGKRLTLCQSALLVTEQTSQESHDLVITLVIEGTDRGNNANTSAEWGRRFETKSNCWRLNAVMLSDT